MYDRIITRIDKEKKDVDTKINKDFKKKQQQTTDSLKRASKNKKKQTILARG